MGWTKRQRATIKYFLTHKDHPPTLSEFIPKLMAAYLILAILALVEFLCLGEMMPSLSWFFAGMMFGAALRMLNQLNLSLENWPVIAEVTDWEKVSQLAAAEGLSEN